MTKAPRPTGSPLLDQILAKRSAFRNSLWSKKLTLAGAKRTEGRSGRGDHWTPEKIARFGFLLGLGWDSKRIAEDRFIASTRTNVLCQAHRFGLSFRVASSMSEELPLEALLNLDKAAAKRGIKRWILIRNLLLELASDPTLIDNILDDEDVALEESA